MTPLPTNRKYLSLQAGRGIAAMLVVIFHGAFSLYGDSGRWEHSALTHWIYGGRLGVSFFFVLSGVVILLAHWKDLSNPTRVGLYLKKRFLRIYPIYWLVLAALLLSQMIFKEERNVRLHQPFVVLSNVLLVHIHSRDCILPVTWTLFLEITFYALFAVLIWNKRLGACLLGLWMVASLLPYLSRFNLLFGLGLLVTWLMKTRTIRFPRTLLVVGSVLFAGAFLYTVKVFHPSTAADLASGLGFALVLLGALELERQNRLSVSRTLVFAGDASFSIYLVHEPFMEPLTRLAFRVDAHLPLPPVVWLGVFVFATIAAGCLTYVFVERPLLNWIKQRHFAESASQTA